MIISAGRTIFKEFGGEKTVVEAVAVGEEGG
jgi:hypothetical protein